MNDTDSLNGGCPDRENVLSVVEGANVPSDEAGAILGHLSRCLECRQAVSFVCAAAASEKRRRGGCIAPVWNRIISAIDIWANRHQDDVPAEDDMALAAVAPRRALVFSSVSQPNGVSEWRAEVNLPAPDDPNGELQIVVQDGMGNPLCGMFRLCGVECAVERGKPATIAIREFRKSHSEGGVAFAETGKPFVKGTPILSSIL